MHVGSIYAPFAFESATRLLFLNVDNTSRSLERNHSRIDIERFRLNYHSSKLLSFFSSAVVKGINLQFLSLLDSFETNSSVQYPLES